MTDVEMYRRYNLPAVYILLYGITTCMVFVVSARGPNPCPHDGVSYEGRCYWVSESKSQWADAGILCHRLYGDNVTLVTIKGEGTNRFVRGLTNETIWIGLHETHGENEWRWVDNTLPDSLHYSNWRPNAPAGMDTKNCAVMYKGADQWKDVGCKKTYTFVCSELSSSHICSKGGIFFRDRCYWPAQDPMTWNDANTYCQEHFDPEARLSVAKDAGTNLFLSRLIYPGIWLGLHDKKDEGIWTWVDGSPYRYSNWRIGEPNNVNHEDCAVLHYDDALWNDQPCGRLGADSSYKNDELSISYDGFVLQPIINMNRFVCAIPNCYNPNSPTDDEEEEAGDDGSGSGSIPDTTNSYDTTDSSTGPICLTENCPITCLPGSVCNGTDGQCLCVKHFPEMVCDMNDFKLEIMPAVLNATLGGNFSLKCQVNLPAENVFDKTITWGSIGPFDENRTKITNSLHRGFSLLEITDVQLTDAKPYTCAVLMTPTDMIPNYLTSASATVEVVEPLDVSTTDVNHVTTTILTTALRRDHETDAPPNRTTISFVVTTETNDVTPAPSPTVTQDNVDVIAPNPAVTQDNDGVRSPSSTNTQDDDITLTTVTVVNEEKAKPTLPRDRGNNIPDETDDKGGEDNTVNQINPGPSNDSRNSPDPQTGKARVAIILLSIMVSILLIALVGLMLKIRRMERDNFGMSRLMELNERF